MFCIKSEYVYDICLKIKRTLTERVDLLSSEPKLYITFFDRLSNAVSGLYSRPFHFLLSAKILFILIKVEDWDRIQRDFVRFYKTRFGPVRSMLCYIYFYINEYLFITFIFKNVSELWTFPNKVSFISSRLLLGMFKVSVQNSLMLERFSNVFLLINYLRSYLF